MLNSLYGKLAAVLMAVFVAIGGLMIVASQKMLETERLLTLATDLIIGAVAFSLIAALIVFRFLTRRLRTLAESIDAFRADGFTRPLKVDGANAGGDEIDRLAQAFGEMSERIVCQLNELSQADARRRELLANVSHDLRTPLASMQGYLETLMLKEGELTPEERHSHLHVAARHCERLGVLVHDLFELTRLEAHEIQPRLEPFPVAELVQDVAQKFDLKARKGGQRLVTHFPSDAPIVLADIGMIERVLENLIENAMRYTPAGGRIEIGIATRDGRVELRVSDTGKGIAPAELANIFDRYYRVDRGEFREGGNAGLGLAISRRIVELHGGSIRAESTQGVGTSFVIDLPSPGRGRAAVLPSEAGSPGGSTAPVISG